MDRISRGKVVEVAENWCQGEFCWLCARPLGRRIEWHHPVPKSRGGRATVPMHPICHQAVHAHFSNADLARAGDSVSVLQDNAGLATFLRWVAGKPPDFHVRTERRRPRR